MTADPSLDTEREGRRLALLDATLQWAARRVPVFRAIEGGKRPAEPHGYLDATTDADEIRARWAEQPFNVAIYPGGAGWAVLDVDPDKGGDVTLEGLEISHGPLPETYTVKTPHGLHYYFDGTLPKNTAGKLGDGLDTRSVGGYVLVPPSHVDAYTDKDGVLHPAGDYAVLKDLPLAPLPEWISAAVEAQQNRTSAPEVGLDLPDNVALFTHYMATRDPANEGTVNDTGTAHVGMARDMALTREVAWPIIVEEWGARCSPPFGEDDKLADCGLWTSRQNEGHHPWALDGTPTAEVFKDQIAALREHLTSRSVVAASLFTGNTTSDDYPPSLSARELAESNYPPTAYTVQKMLRENEVNLLIGDGKVGKTYVALHMALAVARGANLWGLKCRQRPVLLVLHEDDNGEAKMRMERICAAAGVNLADLPITFWCLPGYDTILANVTDQGDVAIGPFMKRLLDKLVETDAGLLVLDPLSDFANLNEVMRLAANAYCKKVLDPIARRLGVTVVQTGHPSKASMIDGSVVSGSTGWKNAVRNVLSMERIKDAPQSHPRRILRTAWANAGPEDALDLVLEFGGGVLRETGDDADDVADQEKLLAAMVEVAVEAATERHQPFNGNTGRLLKDQLATLRRLTGRPHLQLTSGEVKDLLRTAVYRGLLEKVERTRERAAGYYPTGVQAVDLALRAKREAKQELIREGYLPPAGFGGPVT